MWTLLRQLTHYLHHHFPLDDTSSAGSSHVSSKVPHDGSVVGSVPEPEQCNLCILHFNDVYNVEEQSREPKGGAARFVKALNDRLQAHNGSSMVLFSGDALSPSFLSGITKGEHIVEILNEMHIDAAVVGNHDFDFGVENLMECAEKSNFPWLNTNCMDTDTGKPLADRPQYAILERAGVRIGLIGLVEPEWVVTLSTVDQNDVEVVDFVQTGNEWASRLKKEFGCHIVVALTHMRWPNDEKMAEMATDVDLVLGGHDHDFGVRQAPSGVYAIKSGTDFRDLHEIVITVDKVNRKITHLCSHRHKITGDLAEDDAVKKLVLNYTQELEERMKKEIGRLDAPLELRFDKIRTQETNGGNFVCDIVLTAVEADVALINSGTLRTDAVVPEGSYTLKDLNLMLPFLTAVVVIEATGAQLLALLENSVSQYPKMEGRFLQVGGLKFAFHSQRPGGSRIDPTSVWVQGSALNLTATYKVATTTYVCEGNDGFDEAKKCKILLDDEDGPQLLAAVRNYFRTIQVLRGFRKLRHQNHCQHAVSRKVWNANVCQRQQQQQQESAPSTGRDKNRWKKVREFFLKEEVAAASHIAPECEGRIQMVD